MRSGSRNTFTERDLEKNETVSLFSRVQRLGRISVEKYIRAAVGLPGAREIETGDTGDM